MNHPDTELKFISDKVGRGVFATRLIPKGTLVWTLCELDTCFTPEQFAKQTPLYQDLLTTYTYIDPKGNFMLCWDLGKYVNHSCNPSFLDFGGIDCSVAIRNILPGEELTCDYGSLNRIPALPCKCNSKNCRGEIKNTDLLIYDKQWDEILKNIVPFAANVEQPLYPYIQNKKQFDAILKGEIELPSIRRYYCPVEKMNEIKRVISDSALVTA